MSAPQVRKMPVEEARSFLSAIWPDGAPGHLALTRFQHRSPATSWFPGRDLDALARHAAAESAHGDVYIGCCSHGSVPTEGRGTEASVLAVPGIWVDIDVFHPVAHKSKALPPTLGAALELLDGLPRPSLIVGSGFGIHVWWIFREPWTIESEADRGAAKAVVQRVQAFLRERAKRRGWTLDNTSDLARILRIPGTRNHKTADRPMAQILDDDPARYNPSDFDVLPELGEPVVGQNVPSPAAGVSTDWGPKEGQYRHDWLRAKSVVLANAGIPVAGILPALRAWADHLPGEPKTDAELRDLAETAIKKYGRQPDDPVEFDPVALDLERMLVTDAPPVPSVIGPYLAREDNVLLGGEWGSGKTPLAHALILALVTGGQFLKLVPVTSDEVFRAGYLDEENGDILNHYRLNRTVRGMGADPRLVAERLSVFSKQRWGDLTKPRGRDALRRIVDRYKLTHVVLDSIVRFIGNRDENSSSDMSDWYGGVVEFLNHEHGCRVIGIHHWRKPNSNASAGASDPRHRFRGSSDIPAQFDQVLAYDMTGEPDARNLIHVRSRWDDYAPLRIVKKIGSKADPHEHLEALDAPATVESLVRNRLLQDGVTGTLRQDLLRIVMSLGLSEDAANKTLNRTLGSLKDRRLAVTKKEGKSSRYWDYSLAPAHAREVTE